MEYSRLAKGHFTSTGNAQAIVLPFVPDAVELYNFTAATTPAQFGVPHAYWDDDMGQGAAQFEVFDVTPALITGTTLTTGISTFSAGVPQYGSAKQIASITKANPAVVTTAAAHGYATGDVVIFQGLFQSATTGMPQLCGMPFVITVTGATTFTIPWNTNQSNYTALAASPAGAVVRKVLFPYLYFPGVSFISAITLGASTTISTTANHNMVVGQEVAFRIPTQWGTSELSSPDLYSNPLYGYVTSVASATQVVVNINTTSGYSAFNSNPSVAQVQAGLSFPQMVAVGDSNLGPVSNAFLPVTINSATIGGAFQNNTRQGFIIAAGAAGAASLVGAASDVIYWRALLHDFG